MDAKRYVRFGEFTLDLSAPELRCAGQPVRLTPQATRVLAMLVARPGELVARQEIQSTVWSGTIVAFDQSLNTSIRQIRHALGDSADSPSFIETVPRRGYRFLAPTEPVDATMHVGSGPWHRNVTPGTAGQAAERAGEEWNGWWHATTSSQRTRRILAFAAAAILIAGIVVVREAGRAAPAEQPEPAARMAWARGQWLLDSHSPGSMARAVAEFEETVRLDPDFAPAHAALARALFWTGRREDARAPAARALELDHRLAEANLAAGDIALMSDRDFERARRHYDRAIAAAAGRADVYVALGFWFSVRGEHDDALRRIARATELDPLSAIINSDAGLFHYWARRWDAAARYCAVAADLQPAAAYAIGCIIDAHMRAGRLAEAAARIGPLLALEDADSAELRRIASATPAQAIDAFRQWRAGRLDRYASSFARARILADVGKYDRALDELERAVAEKLPSALTLAVDPAFDALHGNARFDALVRRVLGEIAS